MDYIYTESCGCVVEHKTEMVIKRCNKKDCKLEGEFITALQYMESGEDEYRIAVLNSLNQII